jgi:hypothetical protein
MSNGNVGSERERRLFGYDHPIYQPPEQRRRMGSGAAALIGFTLAMTAGVGMNVTAAVTPSCQLSVAWALWPILLGAGWYLCGIAWGRR